MGRKPKYSQSQKVWACEQYLSGQDSARSIAYQLGMGKCGRRIILEWSAMYQAHGASTFEDKPRNNSYSASFKALVIEDHFLNGLSPEQLAVKYNIPSRQTIWQWINKYNSHEEIKDYSPCPEVYMTKRKKSTIEEREKVVTWCLEHDRNYKKAAAKFEFSYGQVYSWVTKYDSSGVNGIEDRRGKRKEESELTDTERLTRELRLAQAKMKELERENALLKKVNELDWRW
ncbi:hypothetical protein C815_00060 [Firmicutes bacterium M10-2]|nr:hypothetical protein C815_00060 [Firmicutes bacterium M10-2]